MPAQLAGAASWLQCFGLPAALMLWLLLLSRPARAAFSDTQVRMGAALAICVLLAFTALLLGFRELLAVTAWFADAPVPLIAHLVLAALTLSALPAGVWIAASVPWSQRRRLRARAADPTDPLENGALDDLSRLSRIMGLRRAPELLVTAGPEPPQSYWGLGGRGWVAVPPDLDERTTRASQDLVSVARTLKTFVIAHELAHIANGETMLAAYGRAVYNLLRWWVPLTCATYVWTYFLVPGPRLLWSSLGILGLLVAWAALFWVLMITTFRRREHLADDLAGELIGPAGRAAIAEPLVLLDRTHLSPLAALLRDLRVLEEGYRESADDRPFRRLTLLGRLRALVTGAWLRFCGYLFRSHPTLAERRARLLRGDDREWPALSAEAVVVLAVAVAIAQVLGFVLSLLASPGVLDVGFLGGRAARVPLTALLFGGLSWELPAATQLPALVTLCLAFPQRAPEPPLARKAVGVVWNLALLIGAYLASSAVVCWALLKWWTALESPLASGTLQGLPRDWRPWFRGGPVPMAVWMAVLGGSVSMAVAAIGGGAAQALVGDLPREWRRGVARAILAFAPPAGVLGALTWNWFTFRAPGVVPPASLPAGHLLIPRHTPGLVLFAWAICTVWLCSLLAREPFNRAEGVYWSCPWSRWRVRVLPWRSLSRYGGPAMLIPISAVVWGVGTLVAMRLVGVPATHMALRALLVLGAMALTDAFRSPGLLPPHVLPLAAAFVRSHPGVRPPTPAPAGDPVPSPAGGSAASAPASLSCLAASADWSLALGRGIDTDALEAHAAACLTPDGGYAEYPGSPPSMEATHSALMLLRLTRCRPPRAEAAADWAASCRRGALYASSPGEEPSVIATAAALEVLTALEDPPADEGLSTALEAALPTPLVERSGREIWALYRAARAIGGPSPRLAELLERGWIGPMAARLARLQVRPHLSALLVWLALVEALKPQGRYARDYQRAEGEMRAWFANYLAHEGRGGRPGPSPGVSGPR